MKTEGINNIESTNDKTKKENEEEYVTVEIKLKKESFDKLQSITVYANVKAKMDKVDVEYAPEDFAKGATLYFIEAMLDNIDYTEAKEVTKKFYELLPEILPILNESAKQLDNTSKENIESLIDTSKGPIKNNIKKIMKELKITQKELSEMTGIDKSNLSIYMNNKSQPSIEFFLRIWHALNYPPLTQMLYREVS